MPISTRTLFVYRSKDPTGLLYFSQDIPHSVSGKCFSRSYHTLLLCSETLTDPVVSVRGRPSSALAPLRSSTPSLAATFLHDGCRPNSAPPPPKRPKKPPDGAGAAATDAFLTGAAAALAPASSSTALATIAVKSPVLVS